MSHHSSCQLKDKDVCWEGENGVQNVWDTSQLATSHRGQRWKPSLPSEVAKAGQEVLHVIPYKVAKIVPDTVFEGHMAGLDPGVRKFMTLYGTDGRVGFFGSKNPVKKFKRMEWWKDLIKSQKQCPSDGVTRATVVVIQGVVATKL